MRIPNVETIVATHTALPPLPKLPLSDRKRDVFLSLQQSLLSLGQFYDADSMSTLDSETVQLTKYGISILSEKRDHTNGLYFILLQGYPTSPPSALLTTCQPEMFSLTISAHTPLQAYVFANSAYHMNTLSALVQFLHRACFSPVVDTWCKAIDAGYFTT